MPRWSWISVILFAVSPVLIISFQNCGPAIFSGYQEDSLGSISPEGASEGQFQLLEQVIQTPFNTPVTWSPKYAGEKKASYQLSLDSSGIVQELSVPNLAQVQIMDSEAWNLQMTPAFGYRGEVKLWIFAFEGSKLISQAQVTFVMGSVVNWLSPALAVRATGCIMCHAEIHSNVITDFGFGSPFYFGSGVSSSFAWNDGSPYGDHESVHTFSDGSVGKGAWANLKLFDGQTSVKRAKVIVPLGAQVPSDVQNKLGVQTLKQYIENRLGASSYVSTRQGQVTEASQIYIGAPTASKLETRFSWSAIDEGRGFKFIPDSAGWALSGLNVGVQPPPNQLYKTEGASIVCEGDLMLKGSLLLDNVTIRTRSGCRLYVTQDVYIYGPIQLYQDNQHDYSKRNIQITAGRSILMGLGHLWKNNQHCEHPSEDSGYWSYHAHQDYWTQGMNSVQKNAYTQGVANSANYRLSYFWGIPNFFLRGVSNPKSLNQQIYQSLVSNMPGAQDAACTPGGRGVRYERILLNAPLIHSRYAGGIKGSVIAEFALMPLGLYENQSRFKFEFDPVFSQVEVLPMLKEQDFLKVE